MDPFIKNLRYVLRHKWFVFLAGLVLNVPIWQLLIHDLSKFGWLEWTAYSEYFYGGPHLPLMETHGIQRQMHLDGIFKSKEQAQADFDRAWLSHIHKNPHHWQHWVLREDDGIVKCLDMPDHYVREMIADWAGAGKAQGKKPADLRAWYEENKSKQQMSNRTRFLTEMYLDEYLQKVGV